MTIMAQFFVYSWSLQHAVPSPRMSVSCVQDALGFLLHCLGYWQRGRIQAVDQARLRTVDDFLWCFDLILSVDTISWMTGRATSP